MKKQSIWVFQWRKSVYYWWSYILFSPECKELTSMLDPLLYRWGVPPVVIRCVHWTMQMWVLQTWIKALGLYIVMFASHFHPGDVSPPSMSGKMQLSYTQAPSQTHPGPLHLHPGPASPASRSKGSYIIAIPVPSHLHPNHISYSVSSRGVHLKSTNVQSQLHPKPLDLHLNPFRVVPHFHPGCVSPPPR